MGKVVVVVRIAFLFAAALLGLSTVAPQAQAGSFEGTYVVPSAGLSFQIGGFGSSGGEFCARTYHPAIGEHWAGCVSFTLDCSGCVLTVEIFDSTGLPVGALVETPAEVFGMCGSVAFVSGGSGEITIYPEAIMGPLICQAQGVVGFGGTTGTIRATW